MVQVELTKQLIKQTRFKGARGTAHKRQDRRGTGTVTHYEHTHIQNGNKCNVANAIKTIISMSDDLKEKSGSKSTARLLLTKATSRTRTHYGQIEGEERYKVI